MMNGNFFNFMIEDAFSKLCKDAIASFTIVSENNLKIQSFDIDCNQLHNRFYTNNVRDSDEFKAMFQDIKKIYNPVLYWFEIISDIGTQEIISSILEYKKGENCRATPAIKKNMDFPPQVLYVGKVKSNFEGRIITHLGYLRGKGQTQGLQLDGWAQKIGLKLKLNYIEFATDMADYMTIIEYVIAKALKPIVGKHR